MAKAGLTQTKQAGPIIALGNTSNLGCEVQLSPNTCLELASHGNIGMKTYVRIHCLCFTCGTRRRAVVIYIPLKRKGSWELICDLTNRLNLFQTIIQMYAKYLAAFPEGVFLGS